MRGWLYEEQTSEGVEVMVGQRTCKNFEHRPNHSNVAMARRFASMHVSERAFCPPLFGIHNVASRLCIIDGVGVYIR